ncbi:MAG TPA: hypothetical protein VFP54_05120 [Acidimicrobiales bacterium]|nr:hypothetical protein [Acidimicrobiales bacterium]
MNNELNRPAWTVEELRLELDRYEEEQRVAGKARNTVTAYVYPVDRFLNWLDGPYRPIRAMPRPAAGLRSTHGVVPMAGGGSPQVGRSRYDVLRTYLSGRSEPQVRLSFVDIEGIIGQPLPASARRHRAWWANEQSGSHVHARSWLEANPRRRTANVDLDGETVDFII